VAGRGNQRQLHGHPDPELRRIGNREASLDARLSRKLDIADTVGLERIGVGDRVRR
jgi:hypothetical protein